MVRSVAASAASVTFGRYSHLSTGHFTAAVGVAGSMITTVDYAPGATTIFALAGVNDNSPDRRRVLNTMLQIVRLFINNTLVYLHRCVM